MGQRQDQLLLGPRLRNLTVNTSVTIQALGIRLANAPRIWRSRRGLSRLPVVGGIASIPSRASTLSDVIDTILPQVERLHLFLHGYADIPPGVVRTGVIVHLAPASHPYRTAGKFFGLTQEPRPCIYCTFDDDILYGADHVARLRAALLRYGGRALVGIHNGWFRRSPGSYVRRSRSRNFASSLWVDQLADEIGTGTAAFVSNVLPVNPAAWPYGMMDDLMMAIEAETRAVPRIAVARPARSLIELGRNQPDSINLKVKQDDSAQTEQLERLLQLRRRNRFRYLVPPSLEMPEATPPARRAEPGPARPSAAPAPSAPAHRP